MTCVESFTQWHLPGSCGPTAKNTEVVSEGVAVAFCSSVTAGGRGDLLFRMTINEESHSIFIVSACGLGVIQYAGEKCSYPCCGIGRLKTAANLCLAIQINQCIFTVRAQTRINKLVSFNCHIYIYTHKHTDRCIHAFSPTVV